MPIHDWSRVDAGTFHAFHGAWITHLMGALNAGVLSERCYAIQEPIHAEVTHHEATTRDIRPLACRVVVRHVPSHQTVAVIEIVSPSTEDQQDSVNRLERLLRAGVHLLLIDLLPPSRHDPRGMHGAVWARFDRNRYQPPEGEPLTLASYRWVDENREPEAFIEPVAVGSSLKPMPLFLSPDRYVEVPLEATYTAAFGAMPQLWREVLEAT